MVLKMKKTDIDRVIVQLNDLYDLRTFHNKDPYKVLIRTILSQRTCDENTDKASETLFNKYPTMYDVADAPIEDLEVLVKQAGFYRVKSRRIKEVSQIIIDEFDSTVPNNLKELISLPGVGRKTANCVLVFAFNEPAIPVDTHVHRISNRWGLIKSKNPDDSEEKLMKIVPKKYWIEINDLMVQFGQDICRPIHPKCEECPIADICDYYNRELDL